jgi:serine/threonine protein kinase
MLGRYQLLSLVGRGGMGDVYCAVDTHLNRLVAVKILPTYLAEDPARLQRFTEEARVIAALNHPRICVLHDVGHEDGTHYLVFEYLTGQMLSDRLSGGTLRVPEAVKYAIEIGEALEYAHEQGVVHHDLKPQNIILTRTGAKLLDFGIAELRYPGPPEPGSSSNASVPDPPLRSGTLPYMAPEQIEGRQTDTRTDIFAFGVMICEMITGPPVFSGTGAQTDAVMPAALDVVIRGCLAKDPPDRWQSMSDVLLILRHIAAGM